MPLDVVETLADLVRIPSVNPMGRPVNGEIYYEHRVTAWLEDLFKRLNLPYERQPVAPLRDNILLRVDGPKTGRGSRILLLEAHQDTVPVDGMTIPPFTPEIRDGRIYGRGSCDIKGGLAAMLCAVARLAEERPRKRPTVVLACTVNEEHGFTGATALANAFGGKSDERLKLLPSVPEATVVAEPTQLNVVVAHKGAVRWRCHTQGKATHSSQPQLGENAIYYMGDVIQALEQYAQNTVPHLAEHPLAGHPTLSVGLISGGISVNTVPDKCTIEIDRRVLPVEDPEAAYRHAVDAVNAFVPVGTPLLHDPPYMMTRGLKDDNNQLLAQALGDAARAHGASGESIGVPFGTNAPHYAAMGCPTVVFGAGSIDQAHTADEWLDLGQLQAATDILYDFIREF